MRLIITLKIDYDEATVEDPQMLKVSVGRKLHEYIGEDLLTDDGPEVVDTHETNVRWEHEPA